MSKPKIVVHSLLVETPDIERDIIEKSGFELVHVPNEERERFYEEIKDADGIIVADCKVNLEHIESLTKCKVIARQGVGYDSIELSRSKEKGIAVCNVPDYCTDEVSDFSVCLMMTMLRHINTYEKHVKEGIWDINSIHDKAGFPPMRRFTKMTLGIFGFGRIARLVAKKCMNFGFRILVFDPYVDPSVGKEYNATLTDFDTVVKESDVITINMLLTDETRHIFNLDVFKKMKSSAYLINTGRGPLVKEEDLYIALRDKIIAGAAIDVTEDEPPKKDNPLLKMENCIITPHAAFFSQDSYAELRRRACEEAVRVLKGEAPENRVNP